MANHPSQLQREIALTEVLPALNKLLPNPVGSPSSVGAAGMVYRPESLVRAMAQLLTDYDLVAEIEGAPYCVGMDGRLRHIRQLPGMTYTSAQALQDCIRRHRLMKKYSFCKWSEMTGREAWISCSHHIAHVTKHVVEWGFQGLDGKFFRDRKGKCQYPHWRGVTPIHNFGLPLPGPDYFMNSPHGAFPRLVRRDNRATSQIVTDGAQWSIFRAWLALAVAGMSGLPALLLCEGQGDNAGVTLARAAAAVLGTEVRSVARSSDILSAGRSNGRMVGSVRCRHLSTWQDVEYPVVLVVPQSVLMRTTNRAIVLNCRGAPLVPIEEFEAVWAASVAGVAEEIQAVFSADGHYDAPKRSCDPWRKLLRRHLFVYGDFQEDRSRILAYRMDHWSKGAAYLDIEPSAWDRLRRRKAWWR